MICVSWPIPYKNPLRKLFFNTGFQFNYGEPFSLSSFYNATYFQNSFSGRNHFSNSGTSSKPDIDDKQTGRFVERSVDSEQNDLIGDDLTASQLYESIENNIEE